jgi:hypothetical protein
MVGCDEARILEIDSNSGYMKYKESAQMACLNNPIGQPSLDISPIWIPWSWFVAYNFLFSGLHMLYQNF